MMKKILLTCAALASLSFAAPASAQRWDGDFGDFNRREARAERQIERCQRWGGLSWREARELRQELRQLEWAERRMRQGGMNRYEFMAMERRLDRIECQIRRQCRDGDNRPGRGGRGGDYDRDGIPNGRDRDMDNDGVRDGRDRNDRNPYRN